MPDLLDPVRKGRQALQRSWNLRGLGREKGPLAAAVAAALQAAVRGHLTPEEEEWTARIERLRAELDASAAPVLRLDYGAGSPGARRTAAEMLAGVETPDTLGHISRLTSKPPFWCRVLFQLVRHARPVTCLEMGTSVGISAAYQAAALELNASGSLVTLEGAPAVAEIAAANLRRLGLDRSEVVVGRFQDTLPGLLEARQPVDYVFVDGHHDQQATLAYFELLLPALAGAALLVFDDIAWSDGMRRAWSALSRDHRVGIAVDLGPVGLCLIDGNGGRRGHYHIPLP
ncbi:MAG TPA: class I SAM-dependent methyltransferase [Gemmatimonadales bacterium]|nr:class I SAM-dependent methyltransferase [Gemmatimonadales bacterium]